MGGGVGAWGRGAGRTLLAMPVGNVVEEGQPRGGSLGVYTPGREGTTVRFGGGDEHGHGRYHHLGRGRPADSGTEQHRCPRILPERPFWLRGRDGAGIPGPQGGGRIYVANTPHAVRGERK